MSFYLQDDIAISLAPSKPHTPDWQVSETGLRFYSPKAGRWINRDPIEEGGDENLYRFAGSRSVCSYDVLGMCYDRAKFLESFTVDLCCMKEYGLDPDSFTICTTALILKEPISCGACAAILVGVAAQCTDPRWAWYCCADDKIGLCSVVENNWPTCGYEVGCGRPKYVPMPPYTCKLKTYLMRRKWVKE